MIYVVQGSTGEYSDHREWTVAYYTDRALAERHAELASAYARECYRIEEEENYNWEELDKRRAGNPFDHEMQTDYTGTNYTVMEVAPGTVTLDTMPVMPAR